jgi:hypothetical protein
MEYVLPADLASSMHSSMHRGGDCDDNSLTAESSSAESHTDDEDSSSDLDSEFVPAEARSLGWQEAFVAPLTRSVQFDLAEELVRPHAAGDQMTASFEQLERERLAGFEQHREHDLKLSRWSKELLLLADMGLVDVERNIALLEDSPNGVESVIDTLCWTAVLDSVGFFLSRSMCAIHLVLRCVMVLGQLHSGLFYTLALYNCRLWKSVFINLPGLIFLLWIFELLCSTGIDVLLPSVKKWLW